MTADWLVKARQEWAAIHTDDITLRHRADETALWALAYAERLMRALEMQYCVGPNFALNARALPALQNAGWAALDALQSADGGDPTTRSGWASLEYLEPWHRLREALRAVEDKAYVIKPFIAIEEPADHDS